MNIEIIDPIAFKDWDSSIIQAFKPSFFHSSAWLKVLEETYRYKSLAFVYVQNGDWKAAIPVFEVDSWITGKRGVCLPFSDACAVLSCGDQQAVLELIAEVIKYGMKRGWDYFEVRGETLDLVARPKRQYLVHTLHLAQDESQVFSGFANSVKRNVRKCGRCGVQIKKEISEDALRAFYYLHTKNRKRHGLPVQPYRFFQSIARNVFNQNYGHILQATYNGRVIASHLYCCFAGTVIYKFGAADPRYLNVRPNNGLVWEAIRWAVREGYKELSFGRTASEDQGLARFKEGWGACRETVNYFRYGLRRANAQSSWDSTRGFSIVQKMPDFIVRLIGELLYKHFG